MKEKLYTIPLNDAVNANDECPMCFAYREIEQDITDLVLGSGSSYMERDMREITDKTGFCDDHFKKMYDFGNTLGNGWILKTHYMEMRKQMAEEFKKYKPGKQSIMSKFSKNQGAYKNSVAEWIAEKKKSCYMCREIKEIYERYLDTFFYLWKNDPDFVEKVKNSKGFCLSHFGDIAELAEDKLSVEERKVFFDIMFKLMTDNMDRMQEDVNWLIEKFDHVNKDADWKNSRDAVPRGMQKLKGGYPADLPYRFK